MAATDPQQGDWVTVRLDEAWEARCRLVGRNGRPVLVELHVAGTDGDPPDEEITISGVLRKLKRTDVLARLAIQRGVGSKRATAGARPDVNAELHGQRHDEDLLAIVAITYEEHVAAGSQHPARDVWEFLTTLYEMEGAPDWPWPRSIPLQYTRSAVRTLIRQARQRGYTHGYGPGLDSATATIRRANTRRHQFFSRG